MSTFNFIPVRAGFLLDDEQFHRIIADAARALESVGGQQGSADDLSTARPVFYLVATGGSEEILLNLLDRRRKTSPGEPVFLVAHPSNNSLPACLEVLARLQQEARPGRIFYLQGPDDCSGLARITEAAHDLETCQALKRKRIGLIGSPSDWLVASSPHATTVQEKWGPTIVDIEVEQLTEKLQAVSSELIGPTVQSLAAGADGIREPSLVEQNDVVRVYEALNQLVRRHELDALTLRCFDLVLHQKTTGCLALARLNDEGVIAGCEGDLVSTVGMLWAHELLDTVPWMANPARLDEARNTLWLAHCTVPLSLVRGYHLRSHFESGLGVAIQGSLPAGPVTLLRIGGSEMQDLWLAEGEILRAGDSESLCRTQAEVLLTRGRVGDLLRSPLGNHLLLVLGHHSDRLRSWWESML